MSRNVKFTTITNTSSRKTIAPSPTAITTAQAAPASAKKPKSHTTEINEDDGREDGRLPHPYTLPFDPSEPPNYDFESDKGRRLRLRAGEQCIFSHSKAQSNPLMDLKNWREKLKQLRSLSRRSGHTTRPEVVNRPLTARPATQLSADVTNQLKTNIINKPRTARAKVRHSAKRSHSRRSAKKNVVTSHKAEEVGGQVEGRNDAFGEILDPKVKADSRFDRYVEEMEKEEALKAELQQQQQQQQHQHQQPVDDTDANVKTSQIKRDVTVDATTRSVVTRSLLRHRAPVDISSLTIVGSKHLQMTSLRNSDRQAKYPQGSSYYKLYLDLTSTSHSSTNEVNIGSTPFRNDDVTMLC